MPVFSRLSILVLVAWSVSSDALAHEGCRTTQRISDRRQALSQDAPIGNDQRPTTVGSIESRNSAIRVHFQDKVLPTYAAQILNTAEETYEHLTETMGFLPPHSDQGEGGDSRFDIYIVTDLQEGVGGYAGFSGFKDETPRADAVTYLVVRHDLSAKLIPFVVGHEMFHAVQAAYDWWEDLGFMEASATWVVDQIFDDNNLYWKFFPYFNAEPWLPLDFVSLKSPYQYGMSMFVTFLDEYLGAGDGTIVRQMWERTIQNELNNEPDFFDVIDQLSSAKGGRDKIIQEFAEWRILVGSRDDGKHFSESSLWEDTVDPHLEVSVPPGIRTLSGGLSHSVGPYGSAYISIPQMAAGVILDVQLSPKGAGRMHVRTLVNSAKGWVTTGEELLRDEQPANLSLADLSSAEETLLIISNLTDGTYDPETSSWDGRLLDYRITTTRP